jgi:hypothetical protein
MLVAKTGNLTGILTCTMAIGAPFSLCRWLFLIKLPSWIGTISHALGQNCFNACGDTRTGPNSNTIACDMQKRFLHPESLHSPLISVFYFILCYFSFLLCYCWCFGAEIGLKLTAKKYEYWPGVYMFISYESLEIESDSWRHGSRMKLSYAFILRIVNQCGRQVSTASSLCPDNRLVYGFKCLIGEDARRQCHSTSCPTKLEKDSLAKLPNKWNWWETGGGKKKPKTSTGFFVCSVWVDNMKPLRSMCLFPYWKSRTSIFVCYGLISRLEYSRSPPSQHRLGFVFMHASILWTSVSYRNVERPLSCSQLPMLFVVSIPLCFDLLFSTAISSLQCCIGLDRGEYHIVAKSPITMSTRRPQCLSTEPLPVCLVGTLTCTIRWCYVPHLVYVSKPAPLCLAVE